MQVLGLLVDNSTDVAFGDVFSFEVSFRNVTIC